MSQALINAVAENDLEKVKLLLQDPKELEDINGCYKAEAKKTVTMPPLHMAAYFGYTAIAKVLIDHKASREAFSVCKNTAIHFAALNCHYETCKELIPFFDLTHLDLTKRTAFDCVRENFKHLKTPEGIEKVNSLLTLLRQPTFEAACIKNDLPLVKKMVEKEKADIHNFETLRLACLNECVEVVQYLLSLNQIDVNRTDLEGRNLLHRLACNQGKHSRAIPMNENGNTTPSRLYLAMLLIQTYHIDINKRDHLGATPLSNAIIFNDKSMVALLVAAGADLDIKYGTPNNPEEILSVLDISEKRGPDIHRFLKHILQQRALGNFSVTPESAGFLFFREGSPEKAIRESCLKIKQCLEELCSNQLEYSA